MDSRRRIGVGLGATVLVALVFVANVVGAAGAAESYPQRLLPTTAPAPGMVGTVDATVRAVSDDGTLVLWNQDALSSLFRQPVLTDTTTGVTIKVGNPGASGQDLSGDGRYVLIVDSAPIGGGYFEAVVQRIDRNTGTVREVLRSGDWAQTSRVSDVQMSTDGGYAAMIITDSISVARVVRVVISSGSRTVLESTDLDGYPDGLALSGNGRYALIAIQRIGGTHVVRHDFTSGSDVTVTDLTPNRYDVPMAVSGDGRFAVVDGTIHDLTTGSSVAFVSTVVDSNGFGEVVAVSDDGGRVAFLTDQALVDNDTNSARDVYVWTRADGSHRRVSLSDRGTQLRSATHALAMSSDGSRVAYQTVAPGSADLIATGPSGMVMVTAVDGLPADVGVADVTRPAGGGLLTVYRSGEVSASGGASTHDDCNPESPISGTGRLDRPLLDPGEVVTSVSPTPSGAGYWLFTNRGRVLDCGDAGFFGDLRDVSLDGEVIDSVATPTGLGYYMVAADGGVFAFGDAVYRGSVPEVLPGVTLDAPIVAITVTGTNRGYRMVAADGGMFNFGDAAYFGSIPQVLPGVPLDGPVIDMVASATGYLIVADDGGIFNFGASPFHGSLGDTAIPERIRTVLVVDDLSGYVMFDRNGKAYPFGTGDSLLGG